MKSESAAEAGRRVDSRQILPIVLILISVVWIYVGLTKFGFFNKLKGGTPGFLPIVAASVLLVASIAALVKSFKEERPKLNILCVGFIVLCAGVVAFSYLIGLLPSLLLFVFFWIKIIEKSSWKSAVFLLLINVLIGYGVFNFALNVPFPKGLIFRALF
jgi:hypothetical protein